MEPQERYDAQTADILDSIFMNIPDSKPDNLSEFDYCVFRYSIGLSKGAKLASPLSNIILTLCAIQLLGMCTLATSFGWTERHQLTSRLLNFIFFIMTGSSMDTGIGGSPSLTLIYVIDLFTFLIIVIFLFGLFQMHLRENLNPIAQSIHVIFVVDIPNYLIVIFTRNLASNLVDILNGIVRYPTLTVISCILFAILFYIRNLVWSTVYASLFYKSGALVSFSSYTYLNVAPLLYVALPTLGFGLFSQDNTYVALIFSYALGGAVCLFIGSSMTFMNKRTNGIVNVIGVMQLISAVMTGVTLAGYIDDPQLSFNIIFWVTVLLAAIIMLGQGLYHRKYMNRLRICKGNFERLNIRRPQNFLFYMQEAAYEGIKYVADGSFLMWGLSRWQSSWFVCAVLRYASLIPDCPELECLLGALVSLKVGRNRLENFILYEYERVSNMRKTQASLDLMQNIKTVRVQMRKYEQLMKTFSDLLSNKDMSGYLYAGALSRIRRKLKTYIYGLFLEHPNCVQVLRFYGEFLRDLEKEEWIGTAYIDLANSLERGAIRCVNFEYLNLTAMFPRLQKAIPEKYSVRTKRSDNYESTGQDSDDPVRAPTGTRRYGISVAMMTFVGLFLLMVLVSYMISVQFWLTFSERRQSKLKLEAELEMLIHVFSELSYRSVCLLVDAESFDFGVEFVTELIFELTNLTVNVLTEYDKICVTNKELCKNYKWVKEINYLTGLDESNASVRLDFCSVMDHVAERCLMLFGTGATPSPAEQTYFFNYIFATYVFVEDALQKIEMSNSDMKNVVKNTRTTSLIRGFIPWVIFLLVLMIIPIVVYARVKRMLKGCRLSSTCELATGPLVAFLKRDHPTFSKSSARFYGLLFLSVICIGLSHLVEYGYYFLSLDELAEEALYAVQITRQHVSLAAMIASLAGFDLNPNNNYERFKAYMQVISNTFTMVTETPWTPLPFGDSIIEIVHDGLQQIGVDKLLYDPALVNNMTKTVNETVAPGLQLTLQTSWTNEMNMVTSMAATEIAFVLIFNIVLALFVGIAGVCLIAIGKTAQMLRMMVNTRVAQGIVKKGEKSEWRRNILDMMDPVASCLVGCDGWIIMVNQQWCKVFEISVDMAIGKHIEQFISIDSAPDYIKTYEIGDDMNLYVIWMTEEDQKLRKELNHCTEELGLAREAMFPERFTGREPGSETVGFVTVCSFYIMPVEFVDTGADEWCSRTEEIEKYILRVCAKYSHVDVTRMSSREITLLYGINETSDSPLMVLLNCVVQVMELVRELSELEYVKGGADVAAAITVAKHAEFVFCKKGKAVIAEMVGKACWRQINLRGYVEPNSVVLSRQAAVRLMKAFPGLPIEQVTPDVYIVRFAQTFDIDVHE